MSDCARYCSLLYHSLYNTLIKAKRLNPHHQTSQHIHTQIITLF